MIILFMEQHKIIICFFTFLFLPPYYRRKHCFTYRTAALTTFSPENEIFLSSECKLKTNIRTLVTEKSDFFFELPNKMNTYLLFGFLETSEFIYLKYRP